MICFAGEIVLMYLSRVWQAVRKMSDTKKLEGTLEYKSV